MKYDIPKQVRDAGAKRISRRQAGQHKHLDIGYSLLAVGYSKRGGGRGKSSCPKIVCVPLDYRGQNT